MSYIGEERLVCIACEEKRWQTEEKLDLIPLVNVTDPVAQQKGE